MDSKPIIAVDIDDVLTRGVESLRLEVNKRLGTDLQAEHYSIPGEYGTYFDQVWQSNGLAEKISLAQLSPQMEIDQSHILPSENASDVLRQLSARYDLAVVTAREQPWKQASLVWLDKHYPDLFIHKVFKDEVPGKQSKTKGQSCKELGATWLIDDNVAHARTALDEGIEVILFGDYGWQQQVPEGVTRCKDWAAVLEYFDGQ